MDSYSRIMGPTGGQKRPANVRKFATHFGMFFLLFIPVYRGFQWRKVIASTSSTTTFARNERNANTGEVIGRVVEATSQLRSSNKSKTGDTSPTTTTTTTNTTNSTAMIASPTNDDSFVPENIALVDKVTCGKEKCFFPLSSNQTVGYLVSRTEDREDRRERFETLEAGYNLAQELQQEFRIQHFLLAPPQVITVSSELESRLNRNLWSEKFEKLAKKNHKRFPKGSKAFIQKVKMAPKRTILIGCSQTKVGPFKNHVEDFVKEIKYTESFSRRVDEHFAQVREIFKTEPCLVKDFQIMLDTKGDVYHLDFDRCFPPDNASVKYVISDEETATCLETLNFVETELRRNLGVKADTSNE